MTLLEAIKSGRPFRRPSHDCFWELDKNNCIYRNNNSGYRLSVEDLEATDWDLESRSITITSENIYAARAKSLERFISKKALRSSGLAYTVREEMELFDYFVEELFK